MKKNLIVRQDGYKECGSASLLSIIRYYQGNISINKLIELTKTDKFGTNFYNIKEAAYKVGLNAKGFNITDFSCIKNIKIPFICQIRNNKYMHFVVVYKITKNKITIMDPAKGFVKMSRESFIKNWTGYIMLFEPYKNLTIYKTNKYLNDIIIQLIIKNKKIIINIMVISFIFTLLMCLSTFYFKIIIDNMTLNNTISNLNTITIIFIFILITKNIADLFRNQLLIHLNKKIDCSLILNTFQKILLLPYDYYKNKTTGEIISRINDLGYIKNILSKMIITVFLDIIMFLIGGIILYNISHTLLYYLIIIILVYILILYIFRPYIKKLTNINQENAALVNSFMIENISGFETVKGLNIENIIEQKMDDLYIKNLHDIKTYNKINSIESFIKEIISDIGILFITYLGFKQVVYGNMTIGSLITFNYLITYFLEPIRNIIDLNKEYYYCKNALNRANNLFEIDTEDLKYDDNIIINGNIKFKDVSYSFNGKNTVLEKVNLQINNKEKVLIVGGSGSGKSTLLKLINRYHKIGRNKIFINSYDICDIPLGLLRNKIAYISQNEIVYTDTIKNNIVINRGINYEKFLKICKLTYVEDIFKDSFLGYDTLLEENGSNISGGQRQRIILARTLLKNAEIIMIDEGLNELDINLERKILKNLFKYFNNKTFIIISHRNNNMDLFNKVIGIDNKTIKVFEKGVCNEQ